MASTWKPKKVSVSGSMELSYLRRFPLSAAISLIVTVSFIAGAANGANGANNNVKAAAIPPASPVIAPNSSSASSVKTVALPATPVMKVIDPFGTALSADISCQCPTVGVSRNCSVFKDWIAAFFVVYQKQEIVFVLLHASSVFS